MPPHQTHTNLLGKSLLSPRDNTETPTDVCLAWNIGLLAGVIIASTLALFIFILHLILRHHHLKALKKLELANTDLTKAQTVGLCLEALLDRAEQTTLQYIGKYGRLPQEMADEEDEEEAEYSGLNTSYDFSDATMPSPPPPVHISPDYDHGDYDRRDYDHCDHEHVNREQVGCESVDREHAGRGLTDYEHVGYKNEDHHTESDDLSIIDRLSTIPEESYRSSTASKDSIAYDDDDLADSVATIRRYQAS